ncbi:MAG: hypothetical protein PHV82_16940 [Victivallaceae bacterium]|nr:hypothetical protein [Victivallaceae bacterium]
MIGKIVNNQIVTPPYNDGNKFNVHLDAAWLEANGFYELTEAEITAAGQAAKLTKTVFTKLQIREAFKALDKEADLDALLDSNAEFKTYWQDAIEIDIEHEIAVQALGNFAIEEIKALKLAIA